MTTTPSHAAFQSTPMPLADAAIPSSTDASDPASEAHASGGVAVRHFKTSEVVELLDLSRRQLQYWAKTGLVVPSAQTPGGHHRYDFNDLVALKATRRLIDAGVSVQKIRKSVGALRALLPQVGRPLSELVLVATGDVVLVFHDETVFEAISGQEWVFPVAAFEREVARYREQRAEGTRARSASEAARHEDVDPGRAESPGSPENARTNGLRKPGVRGAERNRKRWSKTG